MATTFRTTRRAALLGVAAGALAAPAALRAPPGYFPEEEDRAPGCGALLSIGG